jgi:hypothetical protein
MTGELEEALLEASFADLFDEFLFPVGVSGVVCYTSPLVPMESWDLSRAYVRSRLSVEASRQPP